MPGPAIVRVGRAVPFLFRECFRSALVHACLPRRKNEEVPGDHRLTSTQGDALPIYQLTTRDEIPNFVGTGDKPCDRALLMLVRQDPYQWMI
ncbi:MAG TPA: hypothetical protein PLN56_07990 [Methanoregulaceae archaeon]|nr:MAG: hypothetical protein IPI71_00385 [Methanolinea sp.]HPD10923.1 hypothetical protein [Methanoregulaceae archaeon]